MRIAYAVYGDARRGNFPVEYPSGDEPEEPEPFDHAAVNTALAGILRS